MGIIFIVLILVLLYVFISQSRGGQGGLFGCGHTTAAVETPLEALQKRYARGEIGRDEYQERRRELS